MFTDRSLRPHAASVPIETWAREREALRQDIIEGCRAMGAIYPAMTQQWEPLEEEVSRGHRFLLP
jgi:hypothetical protein